MKTAFLSMVAALAFCVALQGLAADKLSIDVDGNAKALEQFARIETLKKGQFESTKEFEKRVCAAVHEILGVKPEHPFLVGLERRYVTDNKFDPDKREFSVIATSGGLESTARLSIGGTFTWNIQNVDLMSRSSLHVSSSFNHRPSYSASNAFGAKKEVEVYGETEATLYLVGKGNLGWGINANFPISAEEARRLMGDARVAVQVTIVPPCFAIGTGHKPPRWDYPSEIFLKELALLVKPGPEWIVYRESTKEVLKRGKFH